MKLIKKLLNNWHRYVLCALLSGVFWAWIILRAVNAPVSQKVQLFADLPYLENERLEIALEREKPDGIKYVEAKTFEGLMFDLSVVLQGDLYLIPESKAEEYLASFAPIDPADFPGQTFYESDGKPYGITVFDENAGIRIGDSYVMYIADERCFLFFNRDSKHLGAWNGSKDDAAIAIAHNFLKLEREEQP